MREGICIYFVRQSMLSGRTVCALSGNICSERGNVCSGRVYMLCNLRWGICSVRGHVFCERGHVHILSVTGDMCSVTWRALWYVYTP